MRFALLLALTLRLLAALFAKGYIAHDDHFTIIESAASFADCVDYRHWLPGSEYNKGAEGHSFFYLGLHYYYFKACNAIGLGDPQWQMLGVRLIHALYSLLIVFFGFRITQRIGSVKNARTVALILAVLAILPNYSVRNLVEIVCIVPMLWASYALMREKGLNSNPAKNWLKAALVAGLAAGIAMGVRYQTGVFVGGLGLVLLLQKRWKTAVLFGIAGLATFFLTQISDLFLWGEAFAELKAYVTYNQTHGDTYLVQPWYTYILVLAGFLVPPISLMLLFGYVSQWKKHLLLFLPTLLFILVHSAIGNKQERFIFPILPFIIILGIVGWDAWRKRSTWWQARPKLHRGLWTFFWIVNLLAGVGFSLSYSKKARVESLYALYQQDDYRNHFADNFTGEASQPPLFYSGNWRAVHPTGDENDMAWRIKRWSNLPLEERPNYLLIYGAKDLPTREERWKDAFPSLEKVTTVESGWFDKLLHAVNPSNKVAQVHIYRFEELGE